MAFASNASKISVAERAVWLLDIAESNRVRQQTLTPPNCQSTIRSNLQLRSKKVSIKDRVRLFESMIHSTQAVVDATPPERPHSGSIPHPLQEHHHESKPSSDSSSLLMNNIVEIIASADTSTTSTATITSLSPSCEDNTSSISPNDQQSEETPCAILSSSEEAAEPEPLLGLPVTSVSKPISRRSFEEKSVRTSSSTMTSKKTERVRNCEPDTGHESKQSSINYTDDPTQVSCSNETNDKGCEESQDGDDSEGHIIKIVKIVDRSPSPPSPSRLLLPSPWDESDDFSDPWMSDNMTLSVLDLALDKDTATLSHQEKQTCLPTTILNPSSLRNRKSVFTSNHRNVVVEQPRSFVFVDDDNDYDDEDDIRTVDNGIVFKFDCDNNNVTAVTRSFTTSLSFDSTFSKKYINTAVVSPLQPPPISRYTMTSSGSTDDLAHVLNMNWVDVPNKVNGVDFSTFREDDTSRIDKKGLMCRFKSKSTRIPILEMRKKTTSLRSHKHDHPLMLNDDIATRSRSTSTDSNNDTTGLWFSNTFDNIYNNNTYDDVLVNAPPSLFFPPSPLDLIDPIDHANRTSTTFKKTMKQTCTKIYNNQDSILSKPIGFHSQVASVDDYQVPQPQSNQNRDETYSNHFASKLMTNTAILGNVFAEEIAADASTISTTSTTPIQGEALILSKNKCHDGRSSSSVKSAFTYRSASSTTVASTTQSRNDSSSSNSTVPSVEGPPSISKSIHTATSTTLQQQRPSNSDRITSTIAQLCQNNKNAKFQKRSLIQMRKDQLASNLAKNRSTNRLSKGSWQKDSNGNFKRHFILIDSPQQQQKYSI